MPGQVHQFGPEDRPSFFHEDPNELDHPMFSELYGYWHGSRDGSDIPAKSAFVPKNVKSHLPWVVVCDALADGSDFVYRVVGTRVSDYFLGNGTGKTVMEAFANVPDIGRFTLNLYRRTCELRRPTRYVGNATLFQGVYFPSFEALYLPYSSDGTRADRLVTLFHFDYSKLRDRGQQTTVSAALSVA